MISFTGADVFKYIGNHASKTNQFERDSHVERHNRHVDYNSAPQGRRANLGMKRNRIFLSLDHTFSGACRCGLNHIK